MLRKLPKAWAIQCMWLLSFMAILIIDMSGQCVMCKAVAEDSADDGGLGAGLNRGILYLMAVPYILLSALFFVIYRKHKSAAK
jgi:hypothetical protein